MVLCRDTLAIAMTAAGFGAAANRRLRPHLVRSTFNGFLLDAIERHSGSARTGRPAARAST
jgi:hypothetical protein